MRKGKMKIAHLFPIFSLERGGGTVDLVFKLCKALKARGHELSVVASDYHFDPHYAARLTGVEVVPMKGYLSAQGFFITPELGPWLDRRLPTLDVVHLHLYRSYQNILSRKYCNKHRVPYIVDPHGAVPKHKRKRFLKGLYDLVIGRRILADAAQIVAHTKVDMEDFRELGANMRKVVVLPPPFDTDEFATLPPHGVFRKAYKMEEKRVVMFLGRIAWIKGIDFLVEGFNHLITRDKRTDVQLVVVGPDDGFKATLDEMIVRLGLGDRVTFTGFLDGEMKLAALQDADVVVQSSRFESRGFVPFEAVLCGTPIVVTKETGAGEDVMRIDAGYVVELGNKVQLADLLAKALDDPSEIQAKADRAKGCIETHMSMNALIQEYEDLYAACVRERKG